MVVVVVGGRVMMGESRRGRGGGTGGSGIGEELVLGMLNVNRNGGIAIDSLGMNLGTTNMIDLGIDLGMKSIDRHAKVKWGGDVSMKVAVEAAA